MMISIYSNCYLRLNTIDEMSLNVILNPQSGSHYHLYVGSITTAKKTYPSFEEFQELTTIISSLEKKIIDLEKKLDEGGNLRNKIIDSIKDNDFTLFKNLIGNRDQDLTFHDYKPLRTSIKYGRLEFLKTILPHSEAIINRAFILSIKSGYRDVINHLLQSKKVSGITLNKSIGIAQKKGLRDVADKIYVFNREFFNDSH